VEDGLDAARYNELVVAPVNIDHVLATAIFLSPANRSPSTQDSPRLREAGVPRDEIQALARHLDPRTTDIYDVSDDQRRRRAMGKLAKIERTTVRQQQERVTQLRKPPDSLKSRGRSWRPGRESNPDGMTGRQKTPSGINRLAAPKIQENRGQQTDNKTGRF